MSREAVQWCNASVSKVLGLGINAAASRRVMRVAPRDGKEDQRALRRHLSFSMVIALRSVKGSRSVLIKSKGKKVTSV